MANKSADVSPFRRLFTRTPNEIKTFTTDVRSQEQAICKGVIFLSVVMFISAPFSAMY
jgi:hypothetical protein